ncbi:MAG: pyridoxal-5'-phosphate-dependent protein [Chloroflexi bacterium GWB2_49_20]|nr:MAG: pyridoxal-5'-phosphate-dependent protein [Chloroflexi bacterium GWB2_49_20]OGN76702.1 MAG: pyridoxal-5'-phosphate-dependent protein [Chloroflexi bacterium GWC2_49_37]OGN83662.1 MAG: pyridoxal-5'-phosphate-dependent protein [Chloroflexi bacterium GWD2_49_16]HBG74216.1 D-cysteine desulfhydrase family protein [Anaerolineae bacterium]HCC78967.1 D-cysteine desulfhydrase family protein [Anaerolineae bacterium]
MVARINFAHLPTPVEELPRLTKFLQGPKLFIKRDDQTGLAFGGNKTRKLEFLLADALSRDAKTLLTAGAVQSNHCRQTAAAAARFGMACVLVLTGKKPAFPSANLLLDELFGAKIIWVDDRSYRERVLQQTFDHLAASGKAPYLVPYGGSSPIGSMGYAYAMQEFISQNVPVDWIIFASSSGGTQAGLASGAHLFGYKGKILGISIDEPREKLQASVAQLASAISELENKPHNFLPDDILVNADYCKAGYGIFTDLEKNAIKLFAEYEGLLLDPVYTGRAAGGLLDLVNKGYFRKSDRVLFWHTGGQPALFASAYTGTR